MSEKSPTIILPFVNQLKFNRMAECGNKVILDTAHGINNTDPNTKSYLSRLSSMTKTLPYNTLPIPLENYIKEVKIIREYTSLGPSSDIPALVKTEAI